MITISPTPTKTIVTKAFTTSEWDSVDICIITLPDYAVVDAALTLLTEDLPEQLKNILSSLDLFYTNFDFYKYSDSGKADHIYNALVDRDFLFVEFDKEMDSFEGLTEPEQSITTASARVHKYDTIQFKGWGKHTGEEFYTDDILINRLYNK